MKSLLKYVNKSVVVDGHVYFEGDRWGQFNSTPLYEIITIDSDYVTYRTIGRTSTHTSLITKLQNCDLRPAK